MKWKRPIEICQPSTAGQVLDGFNLSPISDVQEIKRISRGAARVAERIHRENGRKSLHSPQLFVRFFFRVSAFSSGVLQSARKL